jgi:hypothetical protein
VCYNDGVERQNRICVLRFRESGSEGSSVQIRRNHHYRNSRNTHQSQAKVKRIFAQAFLDMKSVAVFVRFSNLFEFQAG